MVKNIILRRLIGRQVVPTKEDIASVKNLAERLRGLTDAETLNNILEWQERNIAYWRERGYLDTLLTLFSTTCTIRSSYNLLLGLNTIDYTPLPSVNAMWFGLTCISVAFFYQYTIFGISNGNKS